MSKDQSAPTTGKFGESYPNLFLWLTYGGRLQIHPASEIDVEVWLGDAGGYPTDARRPGPLEDVLQAVDQLAASWRVETRRHQQQLAAAQLPELRGERFIRVVGWPPLPNPSYDPNASPVENAGF